jgi:hypothetical protein
MTLPLEESMVRLATAARTAKSALVEAGGKAPPTEDLRYPLLELLTASIRTLQAYAADRPEGAAAIEEELRTRPLVPKK